MFLPIARYALAASICLASFSASAAEQSTTLLGVDLQVFPGDRFYAEGTTEKFPIFQLAAPFEGKMPGAMRFSFRFAIDSTELRFLRRDRNWDYFSSTPGSFRAWHSMLGDVLAPEDTVGLRVDRSTGEKEWFVDNSKYNGATTIWHRPLALGSDVAVEEIGRQAVLLPGAQVRGLEYLGVRDGQIRIRYQELGTEQRTEEFLFPVSPEPVTIGAMGLRAEVRDINGASAKIRVIRGFNEKGFSGPVGESQNR